MAIVIDPAHSGGASGNVGAINYTRWRGSWVARAAYSPVQPNNAAQQPKQNNFKTVVQAWGTLTNDERQAWSEYAKRHSLTNRLLLKWVPTGYTMFSKLNLQALMIGGSIANLPPISDALGCIFDYVVTPFAGFALRSMVTYVVGTSDIDKFQYWRAGPFASPAYNPGLDEYRQKAVFNIGSTYSDGTVLHAVYYWYRVRALRLNGIAGNYHYTQGYLP